MRFRSNHSTGSREAGRDSAVAAKLKKALTQHQKGNLREARSVYQQVLKLEPANVDALHLLGVVAYQTKKPSEAVDLIDRSIAMGQANPAAYNNRGMALLDLKRFEDALESFDQAMRLQPNNPDLLNNRGRTLNELKRSDEALDAFDRALKVAPDHLQTHNNRGVTLQSLRRFDEALQSFERALKLKPDYAECYWNLAQYYFLTGDFARAWELHAWRPSIRRTNHAYARHRRSAPLPADLIGQHVLVVGEQGLGDELFFLRFVPGLRERGARVTYLADRRLVPMLERAEIVDRVLSSDGKPGASDIQLMAGDLPWLLGAGQDDIPPPFPIPPLAKLVAEFRTRLETFGPPPYVAVTWRAGSGSVRTLFKEVPLDRLAGVVAPLDARLVAIQRLPEEGEIASLERAAGRPVQDLSAANSDLEAMLALMSLFDRYITVSNTNLHLCAACGRPCYVLVPSPPEFRWMAGGEESPWFPGYRVYRQEPTGDWSRALDRLATDQKTDW